MSEPTRHGGGNQLQLIKDVWSLMQKQGWRGGAIGSDARFIAGVLGRTPKWSARLPENKWNLIDDIAEAFRVGADMGCFYDRGGEQYIARDEKPTAKLYKERIASAR